MSLKAVKDAMGHVVAFGPDDDNYSPTVPEGRTLEIVDVLPAPPPQQQRDAIQAQIDALERINIMGRFAREAFLQLSVKAGGDLGYTEPQIYAANIGYRKLKDFDAQITALRDQMAAIA